MAVAGRTETSEAVVYFPQESMPRLSKRTCAQRRNLTPETAHALAELFRVAYATVQPSR